IFCKTLTWRDHLAIPRFVRAKAAQHHAVVEINNQMMVFAVVAIPVHVFHVPVDPAVGVQTLQINVNPGKLM
ncbi:MAG: hypothetical protein AAF530_23215, partial [Pseudomonadota bacterium]